MLTALSTAGLLTCCVSPLLWITAVLFLFLYASDFHPAVMIFCLVLLNLMIVCTFLATCLSKSTQVFSLVKDKLYLLLIVLALNFFLSSDPLLHRVFDYSAGYQQLSYLQLIFLVAQSLSLAGLTFVILISFSIFLELTLRIFLSGCIAIHESVFESLRTAALVGVFIFSAGQILEFFISNLLQGQV